MRADGSQIEHIVYVSNAITTLHQISTAASPENRKLILSFFLNRSVCLKPNVEDPKMEAIGSLLKRELLESGTNRSVLLALPSFTHLTGISGNPRAVFGDLEKIRKMNAKKKRGHVKNLTADESALLAENFLPEDVPFLGKSSYLDFSVKDLVGAYKSSLFLPKRSLSGVFCESKEFQSLVNGASLPNREQMRNAIKDFESAKQPQGSSKRAEAKSCMDCHKGQISGIDAPFDLGSLSEWKARLNSKDKSISQNAMDWLRRMNERDALGDSCCKKCLQSPFGRAG